MPPHPTATTTAAAIRLRHELAVADLDLREDDIFLTVIGACWESRFPLFRIML
jgi:hypothetical protein